MKRNILIIVIVAIIGLAAYWLWKALRSFKSGDYIQLKGNPNSAIWKITDVMPNMKVTSGGKNYTGVYYLSIVRPDAQYPAFSTAMWSMAETEAKYQRVNYAD